MNFIFFFLLKGKKGLFFPHANTLQELEQWECSLLHGAQMGRALP